MNVGQAFTLVGVAAGGIWIGMKAKTYLDEREVYQHYEDALSEVVEEVRTLRNVWEAATELTQHKLRARHRSLMTRLETDVHKPKMIDAYLRDIKALIDEILTHKA